MFKTLITLIIIGAVVTGFIYFIKNSSNSSTVIHTIQFDPSTCFNCYACSCTYTIDYDKSYTLDQFTKTDCIYNLDTDPNGKYHTLINDLINSGIEQATVKMSGKDYESFSKCAIGE